MKVQRHKVIHRSFISTTELVKLYSIKQLSLQRHIATTFTCTIGRTMDGDSNYTLTKWRKCCANCNTKKHCVCLIFCFPRTYRFMSNQENGNDKRNKDERKKDAWPCILWRVRILDREFLGFSDQELSVQSRRQQRFAVVDSHVHYTLFLVSKNAIKNYLYKPSLPILSQVTVPAIVLLSLRKFVYFLDYSRRKHVHLSRVFTLRNFGDILSQPTF